MSIFDQSGTQILDTNQQIFARVDTSIFKRTPIDTVELLEAIKNLDRYVSIKEILDEEDANGYPGERHIYKIKPSEVKNTKRGTG